MMLLRFSQILLLLTLMSVAGSACADRIVPGFTELVMVELEPEPEMSMAAPEPAEPGSPVVVDAEGDSLLPLAEREGVGGSMPPLLGTAVSLDPNSPERRIAATDHPRPRDALSSILTVPIRR